MSQSVICVVDMSFNFGLQKRRLMAALLLIVAGSAGAATFTVTNADASGLGSLRQAVLDANANAGPDVIEFSIPTAGLVIISPTNILPDIFPDPVVIDGTTQTNYSGSPLIVLSGNLAPPGNGLSIKAGSSVVRGLAIGSFAGFGVNLEGPGANRVEACHIGTDAAGTTALPNTFGGIRISQSTDNIIGGTNSGSGNLISGNGGHGILIGESTVSPSPATTRNLILGNRIGTTLNGTQRLPNQAGGVLIASAPGNVIGGTNAAARNFISGNGTNGVVIAGSVATNNTVQGNFIGTDVSGTFSVSNRAAGILISGSRNMLGGTVPGAANLISGNGQSGVDLAGGAYGNTVQGNLIGTSIWGTNAVPNRGRGVAMSAATNNLIGGSVAVARNMISGNVLDGVGIIESAARSNRVEGNFIGVDITGTNKLSNNLSGVWITNAPGNIIGGTSVGGGNVISGNQGQGITLSGAGAWGNLIQGNLIGLDATGARALGNSLEGIWLASAPSNSIGSPTAGGGNVISGNGKTALLVQGTAISNVITANLIGTDISGTASIGNSGSDGIFINGAAGNLIGGVGLFHRNIIAGNDRAIWVYSAGASNTVIQGNFIGTDVTGMNGLGNFAEGVYVEGASRVQIGGASASSGNVISANSSAPNYRSVVSLTNTIGVVIQGNFIGTKADGVSPLGNLAHGINLWQATNTVIGGLSAEAGNVIANAQDSQRSGIRLRSGVGNAILGNSIHSNPRLGISFNGNTPTANDGCDLDSAFNNGLQNYPVITNAVSDGFATAVKGYLPSAAGQTYLLQFYASPAANVSGNWEGKKFLGLANVSLAGCTNSFVARLPNGSPAGWRLTATATDASGSTSEFSSSSAVGSVPGLGISSAGGQQAALSWLVTNASGGTWELVQATNLNPPIIWSGVTNTPTIASNGTWFTVTLPTTNSTRFFRLLYQ